MRKWFMLHDGKHHRLDENLYLHYSNTCDVHDISEVSSARSAWAYRSTALMETRLAPSSLGWVAICYETKGMMTFFVQLSPTRAAWQRIEWSPDFDKNWDEAKVRIAITNFIWVAECEEAGKILPK